MLPSEQRTERLIEARRQTGIDKHRRVLEVLSEMSLEGVAINQSTVASRAGVHRNFIGQHNDLKAAIEGIRQMTLGERGAPGSQLSETSLQTELANAKHRIREQSRQITVLERRLSMTGLVGKQATHDPRIEQLECRIAELETVLVEKTRKITSLEGDLEAATAINREWVRQFNSSSTDTRSSPGP